jgi:cytoskeleton protein RodZ
MSNDLPAMPPAPEEEPPQRVPESVSGSEQAHAPAEPSRPAGMEATPAASSGPAGMESVSEVGARLEQLRTQRGVSLEDISARLKVAVIKLKALEGGDLSRLKDATFALGVVRSYAKILGADPEPMVRALRRAYGTNEQDLSMPASSGASLPRGKMSVNWRGAQPRRSSNWQWGGVALVVVAICLVLVFRDGREPANWFAHLKQKTADTTASTDGASAGNAAPVTAASDAPWPASGVEGGPPPDSNAPATAEAASEVPAPTPIIAAIPAPTQAAVPNAIPDAVPAQVGPASAARAPAVALSAMTAASAPAAAKNNPVAGAASATAASLAGAPATLTFKVTEDSWISVRQQDGREVFSGLVHPGDGQQVEGTRPLKVVVGNVHGIEAMDVDGEAANLKQYFNSAGNVAHFTLP